MKTKTVSVLFMTLFLGLSLLLSGCSFGSVTESIDTTPEKRIIRGEGRYEYFVITKGADGKIYINPISIPIPQIGQPVEKGGK